jgi:SH3-like domain-containing protein
MRAPFLLATLALGLAIGGAPASLRAQSSVGSSLGAPQSAPPPRAQAPAAPQRPAAARPPVRPHQGTPGQRASGRPPANAAQRPRPAPTQAEAARQQRRAAAAAATAAAAAAAAAAAQAAIQPVIPTDPQPTTGSVTGLPLPRFSALRSSDVNLRVGPERRFPVEWRFQRSDLPVQIIREHEQWRRIRDPDGVEGWVHSSNLQPGRRTFLIKGEASAAAETPLRRRAEDAAAPVARLRPGVIGRIRGCDAGSAWCEVQVQDRRGYLKRAEIFGVMPEEEIK